MITVSTTSQAEGQFAEHALAGGLPPSVGYSVYVNGNLLSEREGRPVHPAADPDDMEWPAPEPEVRGG
jgi:hypothetical protein